MVDLREGDTHVRKLADMPAVGSDAAVCNSSSADEAPSRISVTQTADPNHQRIASLGQVHQQLENEQEAQVNRLLQMIRVQQDQMSAMQTEQASQEVVSHSADESSRVAESRRPSIPTATQSRSPSITASQPAARSPRQRPVSMSRQSSRGRLASTSIASSPSLRPLSFTRSHDEWSVTGTREDGAFYQAETQMLQRENQMLRLRIRELERQVAELNGPQGGTTVPTDQVPSIL